MPPIPPMLIAVLDAADEDMEVEEGMVMIMLLDIDIDIVVRELR